MKDFKPLLAGKAPADFSQLRYPLLASPKLDGIRCFKLNGHAVTRTLKPIPNEFVRNWVEQNLPDGIDGELVLQDNWKAAFAEVSSAITNHRGAPRFCFAAFDWVREGKESVPFEHRFNNLRHELARFNDLDLSLRKGTAAVVPHVPVRSALELQIVVTQHMEMGFEGTMVRCPDGRYKFGRSTENEGILLKIKAFDDEEAVVIGIEEEMENTNEKIGVGIQKRATKQEGMIGKGRIGKLVCEFLSDRREFRVGSGLTEAHKEAMSRRSPIGRIVKVKHQPPPGGRPNGVAPRGPVFLGFRED